MKRTRFVVGEGGASVLLKCSWVCMKGLICLCVNFIVVKFFVVERGKQKIQNDRKETGEKESKKETEPALQRGRWKWSRQKTRGKPEQCRQRESEGSRKEWGVAVLFLPLVPPTWDDPSLVKKGEETVFTWKGMFWDQLQLHTCKLWDREMHCVIPSEE